MKATLDTATAQVRFFEEAEQLAKSVHVMGPKVGRIAVYDADSFIPLTQVVAMNKINPGAFAEVLLSIKVANSRGRLCAVVREGRVKEGVIEWSKRADLMRGWSKQSMAKFFEMAPSDTRLSDIGHAIRDVCKEHLKLAVGFEGGRLKVLTHAAMSRKNDMRVKDMIANNRKLDEDNQVFTARGALPSGQKSIQMTIFPVLEDSENDD